MVFVFHLLENYLITVEDIHLKKNIPRDYDYRSSRPEVPATLLKKRL